MKICKEQLAKLSELRSFNPSTEQNSTKNHLYEKNHKQTKAKEI
jgi:hypothetical protein